MSDLERLLDLQANDIEADRARHRRANLPELTTLAELEAQERQVRAGVAAPAEERARLAREQTRLEDEIASLEAKIAHVDHQLYGEGLTSPKEAQALQADLDSLRRRLGVLEDEVLALMEQSEPLDGLLAEADGRLASIAAEREAAERSLDAARAELDDEIAALEAARHALVTPVPPVLLDEYERIRAGAGGIGVARLSGSTCTGCHLSLAAAEIDAIRRAPVGSLSHCPDCGRLLVP